MALQWGGNNPTHLASPLQYTYRTKITPHFEAPPRKSKKLSTEEGKPHWLKIGLMWSERGRLWISRFAFFSGYICDGCQQKCGYRIARLRHLLRETYGTVSSSGYSPAIHGSILLMLHSWQYILLQERRISPAARLTLFILLRPKLRSPHMCNRP